ncbi:hypothetical protein NCCP2222_13330 [Sporosarcina sp. NCCP-2222]|uniref:hypothetical protein n=1 Tax=Sporosarcina sp. NCCP-2222 TaxID=2935073 RepID=UPI00208AED4B|nr:hypothetical protein [Sporosarcina sp. NCCP-2222]GKV55386.1 hypothetical protein NCCP2222_13330 [Sporosarcina sp. NCCP-2222]
MDRLMGILLICLTLLTAAIMFGLDWLLLIVFLIGLLLVVFGGERKEQKHEFLSDEEIESELVDSTKDEH